MPQGLSVALDRIVGRMARLSPPRHRELVRGMVAELGSIADPAERTRFALGAITAIARLTLNAFGRAAFHAPDRLLGVMEPDGGALTGVHSMSQPTPRTLLLRLATPFAISFAMLSLLLLGRQAVLQVPQLKEGGVPAGTIVEVLLLTVPFTVALTIPMAVFFAVSWVFMQLGAEGVLARAQRERHGIRRLVTPVLAVSAVIAALTFISNTQIVPRTNERFVAVLEGASPVASDRTMTMGELQEAARNARITTGPVAAARAAAYEVEIQKKVALPFACVLLALAGAAIAFRFPHGGRWLIIGSAGLVFTGYYLALVAGESLADRQVISPFVAMWMANASLLVVGLLLIWRPGRDNRGAETPAIGA